MNRKIVAGLLVVTGLLSWSCSQDAPAEKDKSTRNAPTQSPVKVVAPPINSDATTSTEASGEPDSYGRLPGDEHYGHAHAPAEETQSSPVLKAPTTPSTTPASGPDAYGRMPGHEHYGHSHE